jgi:DNA-binding beta-propeller fold protein YncE
VDASNNVYVADVVGQQVVKFAPDGTVLLTFPQPAGSYPNQIALDSLGNLYVGQCTTTADDDTGQSRANRALH